jgi:hypothetical protein
MTIVTIVHKSQMKASVHPIDLEQRVSDFAARVISRQDGVPPESWGRLISAGKNNKDKEHQNG